MNGREEWTDLELSSDTDAVDQERLGQVLARINEVAAVPAAAARLLELTRNERSGFTPVVQALAEDPAMAAEVLRIANSPLYAQAEKVSDLKRAVTLIGMAELNVMAGAMAMAWRCACRPCPLTVRWRRQKNPPSPPRWAPCRWRCGHVATII